MLMSIFQQAGESGPNGQSITVVSFDDTGIRYDRQRQPFRTILQMMVKVPDLVQMRLISYRSKMEAFILVAEFEYMPVSHIHTFFIC